MKRCRNRVASGVEQGPGNPSHRPGRLKLKPHIMKKRSEFSKSLSSSLIEILVLVDRLSEHWQALSAQTTISRNCYTTSQIFSCRKKDNESPSTPICPRLRRICRMICRLTATETEALYASSDAEPSCSDTVFLIALRSQTGEYAVFSCFSVDVEARCCFCWSDLISVLSLWLEGLKSVSPVITDADIARILKPSIL